MFCSMYGHTKENKIRNEIIRFRICGAPTEDKLRQNHLRKYGHIQYRDNNAAMRRIEIFVLERVEVKRKDLKRHGLK